jgi:NADH dehydrogenase [ubiquinone] 1 alpha subcomplex assembly factor 7
MSTLADALRAEIRRTGPLPLARFMDAALNDPVHGYYRTRDPLGAAGDFVTAPEISQMFGELLGVWLAYTWQQMGSPGDALLVELGPGRGTLMGDALRATQRVPGFHESVTLHLVETNPVLRQAQHTALHAFEPMWHARIADLPPGPMFLVANEFFDALPIDQYIFTKGAWHERHVGLKKGDGQDEDFVFVIGPPAKRVFPPGVEGAIREDAPAAHAVLRQVATRLASFGGAAIIVDYGTAASETGDSLQAMRGHARHDPLTDPGSADLTAHVDFAALADIARQAGAKSYGPMEQGKFLEILGITQRTEVLSKSSPEQTGKIGLAVKRLIAPTEMGTLFKALALTGPQQPTPPGYAESS